MKPIKFVFMIAFIFLTANSVSAATLKAGSCRGVSTANGYKYVGTYCEDFACTVTSTYMFDTYCPYQV